MLLSSPMGQGLKRHDSRKQLFCHSSNPLWYISRPISARLFSIASAPASTTTPPDSLPHHCLLLLDVPCPDEKTLFLRFLTRECQVTHHKCLFRKPLALLPTSLPRGRRSQHCKSACSSFRLNFRCLIHFIASWWCSSLTWFCCP